MPSIGLSLVDSTDNIGSVFNRLLGVESSVFTCHTLDKNLGMLVNENEWLGLFGIDTS